MFKTIKYTDATILRTIRATSKPCMIPLPKLLKYLVKKVTECKLRTFPTENHIFVESQQDQSIHKNYTCYIISYFKTI